MWGPSSLSQIQARDSQETCEHWSQGRQCLCSAGGWGLVSRCQEGLQPIMGRGGRNSVPACHAGLFAEAPEDTRGAATVDARGRSVHPGDLGGAAASQLPVMKGRLDCLEHCVLCTAHRGPSMQPSPCLCPSTCLRFTPSVECVGDLLGAIS